MKPYFLIGLLLITSCDLVPEAEYQTDDPHLISSSQQEGEEETRPMMQGRVSVESLQEGPAPSPSNRLYSLAAPEGNDILASSTNQRHQAENQRARVEQMELPFFISPPEPDHFGAVHFEYPIETPPGRSGIGPQLSLNYHSQSGDGWLGLGWNLQQDVIARSTEYGIPTYEQGDVFTYQGKNLVKTSGDPESENGTYRLQIEERFLRFELTNIEQGGHWVVYDQDGVKHFYGQHQESRISHPENSQKTYQWYLDKKEDLHGNFLTITYDTNLHDSHHTIRPKEIRYTGNTFQNLPAHQYVRFLFKERKDQRISSKAGFPIIHDRLLDHIEIGWNDPATDPPVEKSLWFYQLIYEPSDVSGKPLLKTVESNRTEVQPKFSYQNDQSLLLWNSHNNPHFNQADTSPENTQYFEGDFNGDSLSDILWFEPSSGEWSIAESQRGGGFLFKTIASRFQQGSSPQMQWIHEKTAFDYNGDGRDDVAFFLPPSRRIWVASYDQEHLTFQPFLLKGADAETFPLFSEKPLEWFAGDFNGDGLLDQFLFDQSEGHWYFLKNTGDGFDVSLSTTQFRFLFRSDYSNGPQISEDLSEKGENHDSISFFIGDYNGDDRSDLSFYDARDGKWWVGESKGVSDNMRLTWRLYQQFKAPQQKLFSHQRFSGDFNGDGRSDFLLFDREVGHWVLGTTEESTIHFQVVSRVPQFKAITRWLQGDFNGDGRSDIGFYSKTNSEFWVGEATLEGFRYRVYHQLNQSLDSTILETPLPHQIENDVMSQWFQGDFNGDGKTDLSFIGLNQKQWHFAMSSGNRPDLIEAIQNGIQGTYSFRYQNSGNFDNTGSDSAADLPFNFPVCTSVHQEDGFGNHIRKDYDYEGGFASIQWIGGRQEMDLFGFSRFTTMDASGLKKIQTYHNAPYDHYLENRALGGALERERLYGSDGRLYQQTEYHTTVRTLSEYSGHPELNYFRELQKVESVVEGVLTETQRFVTEFSEDFYGIKKRTQQITDHYQDHAHSAETISQISYFENIPDTNQHRLKSKVYFAGTNHETETSYEYDSIGNLIKEVKSYTSTGLRAIEDRIMSYGYDVYGNQISIMQSGRNSREEESRLQEMAYDSILHQFLTEERSWTDNGSLLTRYEINYGHAFGKRSDSIDANGNRTGVSYDRFGRVTERWSDTDSGIQILESYARSAAKRAEPFSIEVTQFSGMPSSDLKTRFYYDGLGRELHRVESAPGERFIKSGLRVYDNAGRLIRQSQPSWVEVSEIKKFFPNHHERFPTRTEYDPIGRVHKVIPPKAAPDEEDVFVMTLYEGPWESSTEHSSGGGTRQIRNSRNQVLYVTDFGTGDDGQYMEAKMGFCYDIAGNRIKKTDLNTIEKNCDVSNATTQDFSGNHVAYWQYDAFGQELLSNDPDRGITITHYNVFGDKISVTDSLNQTTTMTYDRLGRLIEKVLPNDEGVVTYTYDALNNSTHTKGRLVAIDDPVQRKELSYDALGRLTQERRQLKNPSIELLDETFITNFRYNLLNQITQVDYPKDPLTLDQVRVCYHFDDSLVKKVELSTDRDEVACGTSSKPIISDVRYNEFRQMLTTTYGNGVMNHYQYDSRQRLKKLITTKGEALLQNVEYNFTSQDNIRSIRNDLQEHQVQYDYLYDGLDRLMDAQGSYMTSNGNEKFHRSYEHSPSGNLTQKVFWNPETSQIQDQWDYTYTNHAVTHVRSSGHGDQRFTMGYDAVGNMIFQSDRQINAHKSITYDSYYRITEVRDAASNEIKGAYQYDDGGFRIHKYSQYETAAGLKTTELVYPSMYFGIENGDLSHDFWDENQWNVINNIYLNGVRIAAAVPSGEALYYLSNQVDSVTLIVDDTGGVLSRFEYYPYGESWEVASSNNHAPKYNGQEWDKESGFYFYNARYYDPQLARFTVADLIIAGEFDAQGWNRYMYVHGNPLRYSDPSGREPIYGYYLGEGHSKPLDGRGKDPLDEAARLHDIEYGLLDASGPMGVFLNTDVWESDLKLAWNFFVAVFHSDTPFHGRGLGIAGGILFSVVGVMKGVVDLVAIEPVKLVARDERPTFWDIEEQDYQTPYEALEEFEEQRKKEEVAR